MMGMALIYPKLSYRVVGCAMDVSNQLGPCFSEAVYQRAMEIALHRRSIPWSCQHPVEITYDGFSVGRGAIDLLVEGRLVLELKAVERMHPVFS